jgi:hypothetical protein
MPAVRPATKRCDISFPLWSRLPEETQPFRVKLGLASGRRVSAGSLRRKGTSLDQALAAKPAQERREACHATVRYALVRGKAQLPIGKATRHGEADSTTCLVAGRSRGSYLPSRGVISWRMSSAPVSAGASAGRNSPSRFPLDLLSALSQIDVVVHRRFLSRHAVRWRSLFSMCANDVSFSQRIRR